MATPTRTANGQGDSALRSNWSTYVSLLRADLAEQESLVSGLVAKSGNLSQDELQAATNASGRVSNLRNLLQLIGESCHE